MFCFVFVLFLCLFVGFFVVVVGLFVLWVFCLFVCLVGFWKLLRAQMYEKQIKLKTDSL